MAQSSPVRHRPDEAGREVFVCGVVFDGPSGRCGEKEQCFKEEECVAVGYGETRELEGRTAEADVGEGVNGGEGGEQDVWDLARDQRVQDDVCDCVNCGLLESDRSCVGRGVEDMQQSVVYQKGEVSGTEEGGSADEEGAYSAGEEVECDPGDGTELEAGVEDNGGGDWKERSVVMPCPNEYIVGRLRTCLPVWKEMGASAWVLRVLSEGYRLPFISRPRPAVFSNHQSCATHESFVDKAVSDLVNCGSAEKVDRQKAAVISPLGVVEGKKLRLILDLRYVNKCLARFRFRCDGLDCFAEMYRQGDWLVQFDLKSAYHHIDIWPSDTQYLGFEWTGEVYLFKSLPFGLSTAPYCFYKITRVLVRHWRGKGYRCFLFYDDGSLAHQNKDACRAQGMCVRNDVIRCGFLLSEPKCVWDPTQCVEILGYVADLLAGVFRVPTRRREKLLSVMAHVWEARRSVRARAVAAFVGHILSMRLAIGPVTRLWTRAMYRAIMAAPHYGAHVHLDSDACREVSFWRDHFTVPTSFPIWAAPSAVDLVTYSDASNVAWGGHFVLGESEVSSHGNWQEGEEGPTRSSTWRELRAVLMVLRASMQFLEGKHVSHRTDNQR